MDRVTVAAAQFVTENLGERLVRPPVLDYKDLLQRSNPLTPIVFVLSPGADPAFGIFRLGALCKIAPAVLLSCLRISRQLPSGQRIGIVGDKKSVVCKRQLAHDEAQMLHYEEASTPGERQNARIMKLA